VQTARRRASNSFSLTINNTSKKQPAPHLSSLRRKTILGRLALPSPINQISFISTSFAAAQPAASRSTSASAAMLRYLSQEMGQYRNFNFDTISISYELLSLLASVWVAAVWLRW